MAFAGSTLLLASVVACGDNGDADDEPEESGQRDVLSVGVEFEVANLDPYLSGQAGQIFLNQNVTESLIAPAFTGEELVPGPSLAESWVQDSPTEWTFKIREGVTFSNGEEFDANDAKFSLDRYKEPELAGDIFDAIKASTVIDDHTLKIETAQPFPILPYALIGAQMSPDEYGSANREAYARTPIGTGPYVIVSQTQDSVTLEANDTYWNKDNTHLVAQQVNVRTIVEPGARVAALGAGDVDLVTSVPLQNVDQVPKAVSAPRPTNIELLLNTESGPFMDPKVREAVVLGTHSETIRTSLYGTEYSSDPRCQMWPPSVFGYNETLETPAVDTERAKQLLSESSYDGQTIRVIAAAGRSAGGEDVVAAFGEQLRQLGLTVQVDVIPYDSYLDAILTDDNVVKDGFEVALFEARAFSLNAVEGYIHIAGKSVVDGFPHKEFPEANELYRAADTAATAEEQEALLQDLAAVVCSAHAYVPIANVQAIWGMADDVEGIGPRPDDRVVLFETTS